MASDVLRGRRILVTRPREQAAGLARLIEQAGGRAILVPAIEIEDLPPPPALEKLESFALAIFISPTAMLYRNLMALDAEEMSRAQPVDGVIFLANCDKTTPAYLMAAASADLQALDRDRGNEATGPTRDVEETAVRAPSQRLVV